MLLVPKKCMLCIWRSLAQDAYSRAIKGHDTLATCRLSTPLKMQVVMLLSHKKHLCTHTYIHANTATSHAPATQPEPPLNSLKDGWTSIGTRKHTHTHIQAHSLTHAPAEWLLVVTCVLLPHPPCLPHAGGPVGREQDTRATHTDIQHKRAHLRHSLGVRESTPKKSVELWERSRGGMEC
jgi:hypothetical protein